MPTHIRNVAIVGAGGHVGSFITRALLAKNSFKITAVSRHDSTSTVAEGVHIARIDYEKPHTIVEALQGQDALIITLGVRVDDSVQQTLVDAAGKAGVPWILPNEFGLDVMDEQVAKDLLVGPGKKAAREQIEKLGASWIGISTSLWYEWSLSGPGFYGIDIAKRDVVFFDDGTQRISTTTWPQVGRTVANLLSLPIESDEANATTLASYRNRSVHTSSFTVTQRDLFDVVKRVTGTADADWAISSVSSKERFEGYRSQLFAGNGSAFPFVLYTRAFFPGENVAFLEAQFDLDNERLGLPTEDIEEATKVAVKMAESGFYAKLIAAAAAAA